MDRVDRRNQLCRELKGHGSKKKFRKLMSELELESEYDAFQHRFRGVFAAMAFRAITYIRRTASQPVIADDVRTAIEANLTSGTAQDHSVRAQLRYLDSYNALDYAGMRNEPVLVKYFEGVICMAQYAIASLSSDEQQAWSMPQYYLSDNQTKAVAGSIHKVDFTIHYDHESNSTFEMVHVLVEAKSEPKGVISDADFGQIADYAHDLWACQPTRLFVPVLFIHGAKLSLVVFTRDKWHRVDFGTFAFTDEEPDDESVGALSCAISQLLYFLSLPPQNFGHFCDVSRRIWGEYEFVRQRDSTDEDQDSVLVDVNISKDPTDSSITIAKECRIEQTINSRGRMAHIFRVEHRGERAILKLLWTPVDRLPESAVYDALKAANIQKTPSIIDSGIIVKNSFGYRVEYMLIEDCGVPLVEYLQAQSTLGIAERSNIAAYAMSQAVECIYNTWSAGIHHCNITANSVVVEDGRVTISDWGHAKFAEDGPVDVDALAAKWLFNKNKVAGNEGSSNPITGTLYYASIPVLIGATQRSIADDVESVLYVAIDALSKLNTDPPNFGMVGEEFIMNKSIAYMRGICMKPANRYMEAFGVTHSSELFTWLADSLREYLFVWNGEYIACDLAIDPEFERTVEIQQLEHILEQIKERVQSEARSQNAPSNTAQSQALPVETTGASTSATKRPRKAAADKNTEPLRRSQRIQDKKKHKFIKK